MKIKNIQTKTEKIPGSVTFKTISTLKLEPRKADDGVSVSCFISSTGESSSATLTVLYKPVVKISHDKTDILEGDTVVFNCDSSSKPAGVQFTWLVDSKEMLHPGGQQHFVMEKMSRKQNNARVMCRAQNSVGTGEDQEMVRVYCKSVQPTVCMCTLLFSDQPAILSHPASVSGTEGDTVDLECTAQGNPAPAISWYKVNSTQVSCN